MKFEIFCNTCDETMLLIDHHMDPDLISSLIQRAFSAHHAHGPLKCQAPRTHTRTKKKAASAGTEAAQGKAVVEAERSLPHEATKGQTEPAAKGETTT